MTVLLGSFHVLCVVIIVGSQKNVVGVVWAWASARPREIADFGFIWNFSSAPANFGRAVWRQRAALWSWILVQVAYFGSVAVVRLLGCLAELETFLASGDQLALNTCAVGVGGFWSAGLKELEALGREWWWLQTSGTSFSKVLLRLLGFTFWHWFTSL